MESRERSGLGIFWTLVASLVTIMSLILAIFVVLDKKKKREDRELEEYLETSIN